MVPKILPPGNICYLSDVLIHNDPGNVSHVDVPIIGVNYLMVGKTESLVRWQMSHTKPIVHRRLKPRSRRGVKKEE